MTDPRPAPYPVDTRAKGWRSMVNVSARLGVAPEETAFRPVLPLRSLPGLYGADMTTMNYRDQLLHPNWQRRRLEILNRANFACELCKDTETTLHVHHKHYVKGRMAWEYGDDELVSLCQPCHKEGHEQSEIRSELLARLDLDGPLGIDDFMAFGAGGVSDWSAPQELWDLLDYYRDQKPLQFWSGRVGKLIGFECLSKEVMEKLADRLQRDAAFKARLTAFFASEGVDLNAPRAPS